MVQNKLIDWWFKQFDISNEEMKLLKSYETDFATKDVEYFYDYVKEKALSMLPVRTINYNVHFDTCATNIIDCLFNQYVDDDTLVITTMSEHPSVKKNLEKCKNVLYMCCNGKVIKEFYKQSEQIRKFKKVFVYSIALSVGDGQITYNDIIQDLKRDLDLMQIQSTFVLDAVQELFMLPRDYSLYDYVIGTAHAFVTQYDTGILFSREFIESSKECLSRGNQYLDLLSILMRNKEKLYQFKYVMMQVFGKYLSTDSALSVTENGPYVFNLIDKKNRLVGITEADPIAQPENTNATLRACESLLDKNTFINKVETIKYLLSEN